ncbi:MAG: ATP-binding cassette domain-containing protein [Chloroflexota bacterium]
MIEIQNLSKSYGEVEALRSISCSIKAGEIVGLLGPNGAGKTTTIKTLTGYLQPGGGNVTVDGLDVLTHTQEVQARIGYLPESAPLYPELSVQGYLRMMADLREIPKAQQREHISDAVHATGLTQHLARPIRQLSKGYRQRVGLAQAILHRPKLLILDEPTVGLDPTQIVEIRRLIRRLAQNATILFSTHILSEVEALCDRVIILLNGEIRADSRLADLASSANAIVVLQDTVAGLEKELSKLEGVDSLEPTRSIDGFPAFQVIGKEKADLTPAIFQLAQEKGWPLRELRRDVQTLESVFNRLATSN